MSHEQSSRKLAWIVIVQSFVISALVLAAVGHLLDRTAYVSAQNVQPIRLILYTVGIVSLLASLIIIHQLIRKPAEAQRLAPDAFMSRSIIACAVAETATLIGLIYYFLGGSQGELWAFTAGTLIVDMLFLLPVGLAYWSAHG